MPVQYIQGNTRLTIIYDATGLKLGTALFVRDQKVDSTYYVNGLEYEADTLIIHHIDGIVKKHPDNTVEYYYYIKNYRNDVVFLFRDANGDGIISMSEREEHHYYPYGMEIDAIWMKVKERNPYLLNEKEYDRYTQLNEFGARWEDPSLGRIINVNRFAEKYASQSTYAYAGNNPILYNDINGDSIDVSLLQLIDNAKSTTNTQNIIDDLQQFTGLSLSVDANGFVTYAKDKSGNAIINKKGSSATARTGLISSLDNTTTLKVSSTKNGSRGEGQVLLIDGPQINSFIKGTSLDLNNKTMGYGMTFLHEVDHTVVGMSFGHSDDKSTFGKTGKVVTRINKIRNELGATYGTRTSYIGLRFSVGGAAYIPNKKVIKN